MNILYISLTKHREGIEDVHDKVMNLVKSTGHSFNSTLLISKKNLEPVDFYREMELAKKNSDLIIADITFNSSGIGHDILWALINRKPVLMIYNKSSREVSSLLINKSKTDKLLFAEGYEGLDELEGLFRNFLLEAKKIQDTKFILIISPEIDRYLEWSAEKRRMHKAQIVRDAVETMMEKDKEFQQYLKDLSA